VAFAINYTLDSPRLPGYPLQIQQCQEALRWIEQHASQFHIDTHRLVAYGGSAGAYLAAMVALLGPGEPGYTPVAAAVSLSGPLNPALAVASYRAGGPCRATGCTITYTALAHLGQFLGCNLQTCSNSLLTQASPVDHVVHGSPPFFLYNSGNEIIPASQATTMAQRLRANGVAVTLMILPGETHGPPSLLDVKEPITRFLAAHVPPAPAPGPRLLWFALGGAALVVIVVVSLLFVVRRRGRRPMALR
jgi:acetyl esterase/lipase